MSRQRPEEQFAFEVVRHVLNARVEHFDTGGRQRVVDAMVHYPDGRTAALEVSSIGSRDEAITGYLNSRGSRRAISGLTRVWYVQVPLQFHPSDLRLIDKILPRCEALGVTELDHAAAQDADAAALFHKGVRAFVIPPLAGATQMSEARAYVCVRGVGGFLKEGIEPLVEELSAVLNTPTMQSKIDKLAATGLEERHLLLHVRPSAFSFPVYDGLSFGRPLPSRSPRLPDGLSQVWLLSGWKAGGVVRAIANDRWHRDHPFDPPSHATT
ncbi:hypothetical protein GCM10022252_00780 [Streptosporangium oxazolinicum]|uniref:Uncharacterized protein n=1 Tax=Streptosporangium oxazolinicum TaxID=909287 RepID=A0ABP8A7H9_9ACTN